MGKRQFFASIRRNQSLVVQLGIIAAAVGGLADSQLEVWIASYLTAPIHPFARGDGIQSIVHLLFELQSTRVHNHNLVASS